MDAQCSRGREGATGIEVEEEKEEEEFRPRTVVIKSSYIEMNIIINPDIRSF
jgi:hypothetical protein